MNNTITTICHCIQVVLLVVVLIFSCLMMKQLDQIKAMTPPPTPTKTVEQIPEGVANVLSELKQQGDQLQTSVAQIAQQSKENGKAIEQLRKNLAVVRMVSK